MAIDGLEDLCTCPIDTEIQALVKIVNNFNKVFLAMASDYEGQVVSLIGRDGCGCTRDQIMAAFNANLVEFGRVYTGGGGGGGTWGSITGTLSDQTDLQSALNDKQDAATAVGLDDVNIWTALNTFNLMPNVPWTSKATGSSTSDLNTKYYIAAFTSNTTISAYVGTPVEGSQVMYRLIGCNGTATFTFPAAQRSGDETGTSTVITPTPGTHTILFTYTNGAWYYQDDNVLAGVAVSGTFTAPITTNPLTLAAYETYNRVLYYGATGTINLPVGVVGMNILIENTGAFTITIDPNGSQVIVRAGTAQTGGVSMTLSSGAGNYVALVFDGTNWVTKGYRGTLAQGS